MDALGIDRAVVYPTLINEYLPQIADREAATVLCRAYNDWLWDFSEAAGGRLHPVAVLPLQDPAAALEELDRSHEKGFRSALFRPAFFWLEDSSGSVGSQMLQMMAQMQSGVVVDTSTLPVFIEDRPFRPLFERLHRTRAWWRASTPPCNVTGPDAISHGGFAERVSERLGVHHSIVEPIAYMQDADLFMTTVFFHGLFEDLPQLRVAIAHSGDDAGCPWRSRKCETYLWLGGGGGARRLPGAGRGVGAPSGADLVR